MPQVKGLNLPVPVHSQGWHHFWPPKTELWKKTTPKEPAEASWELKHEKMDAKMQKKVDDERNAENDNNNTKTLTTRSPKLQTNWESKPIACERQPTSAHERLPRHAEQTNKNGGSAVARR